MASNLPLEHDQHRNQPLINFSMKDAMGKRETTFRTRCYIRGTPVNLIISSGSSANVASESLVSNLRLQLIEHPNPYKLHGLTDDDQIWVYKQVKISFSIRTCEGCYEDEVLFDVVTMQEECLLLGRPWQYDRRVIYDAYLNRYLFEMNGKQVILFPSNSEVAVEKPGRCETEGGEKNEPG